MAFDLDLELVFTRDIAAYDTLHDLDALLAKSLPRSSEGMRIRLAPRQEAPREGTLRYWVVHHATARGETYRRMVETYGGGDERRSGKVEIRGSGPEVVVVLGIDSDPLRQMGGPVLLGNKIAVQVRRAKVERRPATEWAYEVFEALCEALQPCWARCAPRAEYQAKVMLSGKRIQAVAATLRLYLPGLLAVNHFGPDYADLVGRDRLMGTPGVTASAVGAGVQVVLAEDPTAWDEQGVPPSRRGCTRPPGTRVLLLRSASRSGQRRSGMALTADLTSP